MYKVIIADDEPLIRAGLGFRNNWKDMGYEVVAILEDGSDVMKFLENNRADVLLTDICMYQMSGLEVAEKVKALYPWMKVVLLSGYKEFEYARRAMHCQVYEYLIKPIDYEKLREIFRQIKQELDRSNHEEKLFQSFSEEAYRKALDLTKAVTGSVMGEGEQTWMAYARLTPILQEVPPQVKQILVSHLLREMYERIVKKDKALADAFLEKLRSLTLPEVDADGEGVRAVIGLLSDLHDELISRNLIAPEKNVVDDSIAKACNYINNHLGEDFTCGDVADFVHLSQRHFIRRFRSEMNETYTDYLLRVRMEGAMRLMDENSMDAGDIAQAVGYQDDKYFRQLFKKYVGCSPRDYQRRKNG